MEIVCLLMGIWIGASYALAQSSDKNYVRIIKPTRPETNTANLETPGAHNKIETIEYRDGLGRTIQVLDRFASPSERNLIQDIEYDAFGNVPQNHMPYSETMGSSSINGHYVTGSSSKRSQFYQSQKRVVWTNFPQAPVGYDDSPLNRVEEEGAAGATWQLGSNHTIKNDYELNDSFEVRKWSLTTTSDAFSNSFYSQYTLQKKVVTDENGNHVTEYKDKAGRLIKKVRTDEEERIGDNQLPYMHTTLFETYFVYDDFGKLRVVITPKAMDRMNSLSNWNTSQLTEDLVYSYVYDDRGRLIEQKVPGREPTFFLYNQQDQLVLQQDGNQRLNAKWTYYKYDEKGRLILEGEYTNPNQSNDYALAKAAVDGMTVYFETKNNSGYTNHAFPTGNTTIQKRNFYDSYDFDLDGIADVVYQDPNESPFATEAEANVWDKLVRTERIVLDGQNNWIETTLFYDDLSRLVQIQKTNYPNGMDIVSVAYNFSNLPTHILTQHTMHASTTTLRKRQTYDHQNRLIDTYLGINGNQEILVTNLNYNELGQVIERNLNKTSSGEYLQSIDYSYNTRGWVTHINNCDLSNNIPTGWGNGIGNINGSQVVDKLHVSIEMFENGKVPALQLRIVDNKLLVGEGNYNPEESYEPLLKNVEDLDLLAENGSPLTKEEDPNLFNYLAGYRSIPMEFDYNELRTTATITNAYIISLTKLKIQAALDQIGVANEYARLEIQDQVISYVTREIYQTFYNDDNNDLWGECVNYENTLPGTNGTALYNGNINAVAWRSKSNMLKKAYVFEYDGINRLKNADYGEDNNGNWNMNHKYSVEGITYDHNGNIRNLGRKGYVSTATPTFGTMDQLTYNYSGNQLIKVSDLANHPNNANDFKDLVNIPTEYTYDANGNMLHDYNKSLSVSYNVLNLPSQIDLDGGFNSIEYIYSIDGRKLAVKESLGGTNTTKHYSGVFQYENNTLQSVTINNGRIVKDGNGWRYEYQIKDHLGNVRLTFSDLNGNGAIESNAEILQENNYYPFGLEHRYANPPTQIGVKNKFTYNGKELHDFSQLNWLDYGARFYNPELGRWHAIDPLADLMPDHSPYNYVFNNPVRWIDPDGRMPNDKAGSSDNFLQWGFNGQDRNRSFMESNYALHGMGVKQNNGSYDHSIADKIKVRYKYSLVDKGYWSKVEAGGEVYYNWTDNWKVKMDKFKSLDLHKISQYGRSISSTLLTFSLPFQEAFEKSIKYRIGTQLKGGETTLVTFTKSIFGRKIINQPLFEMNALKAQRFGDGFRLASRVVGFVGVGFAIFDMNSNGISTSNSLDLIMSGLALSGVGTGVAGTYFMLNFGSVLFTGKDIGQHIDEFSAEYTGKTVTDYMNGR